MIRLFSFFVLGVALCAWASPVVAQEKSKEVKLEGKICCGKCELGESAKCAVTIVTEKDGKKTTYWFDDKAHKKYHNDVCNEVKKGTVTCTVKKDGEKNIITVTKLEYAK